MKTTRETFASSPPEVRALVEERPPCWEHLLTAALLDEALMKGRKELSILQEGVEPLTIVYEADLEALMRRVLAMLESFRALVGSVDPVFRRLMASWGPPGQPGDPLMIKEACGLFVGIVDGAIAWQRGYRALRCPEEYAAVLSLCCDLVPSFIDAIGMVPKRLRCAVEASRSNPGLRTVNVDIDYNPFTRVDNQFRAIDKVIRSYKRKAEGRSGWF